MCTNRWFALSGKPSLAVGFALALALPVASQAADAANGNGGFANGAKAGGNQVNQGKAQGAANLDITQQVAKWAQQGITGKELGDKIAQLLQNMQRGNNNNNNNNNAGQGVGKWNAAQNNHGRGNNNNNANNGNGKGKGNNNANNNNGNGKGKGKGKGNNGNANNGNWNNGNGKGHAAGNVGARGNKE